MGIALGKVAGPPVCILRQAHALDALAGEHPGRLKIVPLDVANVASHAGLLGELPILLGETGRNQGRAMLQEFRAVLGEAERSDANQKQADHEREAHAPAWMAGRGPGRPEAQPPYPRWIRPEVQSAPPANAPQPFNVAEFYTNLPGA